MTDRFDQVLGAYLGLAIGDALGATVEFMRPREIALQYGVHRDIVGGGWLKLARGQVTDDTTMCLALGDALLKSGPTGLQNFVAHGDETLVRGIAEAYVGWWRGKPVDCGNTCRRGILRFLRDGSLSGPYNDGDGGNGAAMRVSPVAWAFDDLESVLEHATLSARPSHAHPEGIKGAQAVAAAIWTARKTRNPAAVRAVAENFYGSLPDLAEIRKSHSYNETCQGCVPECLAIAIGTPDFESAVRFAASVRGDADTLAAITGSISQALWGVPRAIREQSLAIAARCYPGMERTVAEFEAKFGGY